MKKLMAVLLILVVLAPVAQADQAWNSYKHTLESIVLFYNTGVYLATWGETLDEKMFTYNADDDSYVTVTSGGVTILISNNFRTVSCLAKKENTNAFLRCCSSLAYAVTLGMYDKKEFYSGLLEQFYQAESMVATGEPKPTNGDGYVYGIQKFDDSYGFAFLLTDGA